MHAIQYFSSVEVLLNALCNMYVFSSQEYSLICYADLSNNSVRSYTNCKRPHVSPVATQVFPPNAHIVLTVSRYGNVSSIFFVFLSDSGVSHDGNAVITKMSNGMHFQV